MSETPLRYPKPPDRDDEETGPLPPFEPPEQEDAPDQADDDSDRS